MKYYLSSINIQPIEKMKLTIATTRFNNDTWEQNLTWRRQNEWDGCIYGTPMEMKEDIYKGSLVIILEMNNDVNKIMGLGVVKNSIATDKYYKIYKWGNYNRYTYKSKYRIDRDEMGDEELKIMKMLDVLLFKGSRHLKRGQGITCLPAWIMKNSHINFTTKLRDMFILRFK